MEITNKIYLHWKLMMFRNILFISISLLMVSCAETPRVNINWDDKRCITVHDAWVRINHNKSNGGGVFLLSITGNLSGAHKIATGGGVVWVESYTGDGKMVLVGYNEKGEITSIKDMDRVEISLADVERLGPFINKFDSRAENSFEFQRAYQVGYQRGLKGQGVDVFRAAKRPSHCDF